MDLLSIGTPLAQSSSSTLDVLSSTQDDKQTSISTLERLSSTATPSVQQASSSMMDLLDGFGPNTPMPGMYSTC